MTLHLDPDAMAEHIRRRNREYMRRYRADHAGVSHWKPFIGVDGEGGGTDEHGRQNFLLLRIGHDELFRDNEPLSSADCLDAILAAPADAILVGYFFGYDSTMILKDLPPERIKRLFEPFERGPGRSPYTYFRDRWAIDYRPKQYLRVARVRRDDKGKLRVVEGSSRTIWEVGGFFQKSFVKAITDWNIGTKYGRELIAQTKERRGEFTEMTVAERRYCRMECDYLAAMMTEFRQACHDSGTMPATWSGAGAISAALHRDHQTPKRAELERLRAKRLQKMASAAYYGGRFEVTRVGMIPGPIWEYDMSSAYPDAMRRLPCPLHTRWRRIKDASGFDMTQPFIADVTFRHDPAAPLAHLPFRQKGRLFWPLQGRGTYWGWELAAAVATGDCAVAEFHGGYYAEKRCDCRPYDWVERLYEKRKEIGKTTRGYPLKLGLNGLYGKLAQRMGGAPYRDLLAAGMITAMTRAKLIHAYTGAEHDIVMLATDAVFSRERLPLDIGPGLGQWEEKERPSGLFIVQPGVYWSPDSNDQPKTRGIPQSRIIAARGSFEDAWRLHMEELRRDPDDPGLYGPDTPAIGVGVTDFIGHRLALAQGNPLKAGCWIKHDRLVSFDWSNKREPRAVAAGDAALTVPYAGHPGMNSQPYNPAAPDQLTELDQRELEMEADDDYYPWGNSGE